MGFHKDPRGDLEALLLVLVLMVILAPLCTNTVLLSFTCPGRTFGLLLCFFKTNDMTSNLSRL